MDEITRKDGFPVRRKKKVPKWKRFLRKYWPTIRFGLIVLLILIIVIRLISCGINGLSGCSNANNDDTLSNDPLITEPTKPSKEELDQIVAQLLNDADFIAAGYDYEKASTMLSDFEYFDEYPQLAERIKEYERLDSELVVYGPMTDITHIFFHSLIADPSRAFDGEYTDDGYNLYMTTVDEFNAMLQQMYDKGYVLVTPYQVATADANGNFSFCEIRLPAGKKPFIMSQDDLNYYGYMIGEKGSYGDAPVFATKDNLGIYGDGFAHKLVIDENGYPTCEYMDKDGKITTGDYDMVPALEAFIQSHPDFSYQGARGVLGMTGYEGVFGYRTAPKYLELGYLTEEEFQQEVDQAKEVAQCLRDHGWVLASHSYGHPAYGEISAERVETDSQKWEDTVQPVIGDVDVILYPHGSDIAGVNKYTTENAKFNALYADGYRYFFNVDSHIYWTQLGDNYFRGGRRNMDGYRMYHDPEMCEDLFDVASVFDKQRPTPVPNI